MTYYGPKQLAASFRTVRANTLQIANDIPEDKYSFKAAPDVMSVRELLAHLAISPMWHLEVHPKKVSHIESEFFVARQAKAKVEADALHTKDDVIKALTANGETFAAFLESLDEPTLQELVTFPPQAGPAKTRFEMLLGPKEHEMHHRGQLMLIQRMIGQVPHLTKRRQQMQAASKA